MSRDDATLLDIVAAAQAGVAFVAGLDKQAFLSDAKTQAAVLHQITLVGEATKRLSPAFRKRHTDIPWKDIAGMRDQLIHHYDRVDLNLVWAVVHDRLPELLNELEPLVPKQ